MSDVKNTVTVNYGTGVVCVPAAALEKMRAATKSDITVLLNLLAQPEADVKTLCMLSCCSEVDVTAALSFWRGAGIILSGGPAEKTAQAPLNFGEPVRKSEIPEAQPAKPAKLTDHEVPQYTMAEVAQEAEKPGVRSMVDACEQLMGRMFNTTEVTSLVSLQAYYALEPEYMITLCAHMVQGGKNTIPALKREAERLYNSGVCDVTALNAYIKAEETFIRIENSVKAMFGISAGCRFSATQSELLRRWTDTLGYGEEVIGLAAEKTREKTKDTTPITTRMKYAGSILDDWHKKGLHTREDVMGEISRDVNGGDTALGRSFDTNDFFNAALKASYGDADSVPAVAKKGGKRS